MGRRLVPRPGRNRESEADPKEPFGSGPTHRSLFGHRRASPGPGEANVTGVARAGTSRELRSRGRAERGLERQETASSLPAWHGGGPDPFECTRSTPCWATPCSAPGGVIATSRTRHRGQSGACGNGLSPLSVLRPEGTSKDSHTPTTAGTAALSVERARGWARLEVLPARAW